MTIEERFDFLFQSIESHDRQIGELVENGAKLDARLEAMGERLEAMGERLEAMGERIEALASVTQLNFDRLTLAMTGLTDHVSDHAQRIRRLEA